MRYSLYSQMIALMLVFMRFAGMIAFNPVLSRKNIPTQARMGLIVILTLLVAPGVSMASFETFTDWDVVIALARELMVGLICGFVFQIFYYMLIFAGDQMDMAFGLSMARAFDPGTNIQMSVSSNFLNIFFVLYLFATNSHLLLIRIFSTSFYVIPAGQGILEEKIPQFIFELFSYGFMLAFQLALPFVAMELILEFAVGILMKFIPQINVFVINIQLKVLLGFCLLFFFVPAVSSFIENYMGTMFARLQDALLFLAPKL